MLTINLGSKMRSPEVATKFSVVSQYQENRSSEFYKKIHGYYSWIGALLNRFGALMDENENCSLYSKF